MILPQNNLNMANYLFGSMEFGGQCLLFRIWEVFKWKAKIKTEFQVSKREVLFYIFFLYLQEFQGKKKHDSELDLHVETKVK